MEKEIIEKKINKNITWYEPCLFYADSPGKRCSDHAIICLSEVTFYIIDTDFEDSFTAMDIIYVDMVLKDDVISFIHNKKNKVKRANPLTTIGRKKIISLALEGKRFIYLEMKTNQLRQIIQIAKAKQKYSLEILHSMNTEMNNNTDNTKQ